jgi:hypothetical protein
MKFKKEEISLEGLMYIPEIEVLVKAFFNKISPPCVQKPYIFLQPNILHQRQWSFRAAFHAILLLPSPNLPQSLDIKFVTVLGINH